MKAMSHIITINDVTPSQNASGNTGVLTPVISVWASVEPLNMGRALYYGIVENKSSYKIETRYLTNGEIKPGSVITWNGKTLNIHSILNVGERNHTLNIIAYE